MRAFLQPLDEKAWLAVKVGWKKLEKLPATWDATKIKAANFYRKSLNALFSVVTNEEFKKISSIDNAKEAWTILQNTYEGTKAVKNSKLQRLTTSFKEIMMDEDESFDEFYAKLKGHSEFSLQSWRIDSESQDCQENPQISSGKIPCQDHYHRRIKGS